MYNTELEGKDGKEEKRNRLAKGEKSPNSKKTPPPNPISATLLFKKGERKIRLGKVSFNDWFANHL